MPGYHLNPNRRCTTCTYYGDDRRHLKACVPKRYWPGPAVGSAMATDVASESSGPSVTVITSNDPEILSGVPCDCGYVAKNVQALRMHRMKAKQHQRVPLPNGEFLPEAT
jgi:hypothetical protein